MLDVSRELARYLGRSLAATTRSDDGHAYVIMDGTLLSADRRRAATRRVAWTPRLRPR
ncbi:hypothetical protein ACTWPP_43665 [Actinomadura sp. 3N407]